MGLPFYEQATELQMSMARKLIPGGRPSISNAIQTNATMLNDDWARFFKDRNFLVGVSLDGPPEWHDEYKVDWSDRPTHGRVMDGIESLRRRDVPFNILTVVNRINVERPRELLHWMVDQGFEHLQFIPCVEVAAGQDSAAQGGITHESITPQQYGRFLTELFDAWLEIGIEKVRLRWFDNLIQMLWGLPSEACQLARTCGYLVLEHNGDCYPCDFFVEEGMLLGNVHRSSLEQMVKGARFKLFSSAKEQLHSNCTVCPWLTLCYGECPRYRIANVGQAENSLPYFCESFKTFFGQEYTRLEALAVRTSRPLGVAVPDGSMQAGERTRYGAPVFGRGPKAGQKTGHWQKRPVPVRPREEVQALLRGLTGLRRR